MEETLEHTHEHAHDGAHEDHNHEVPPPPPPLPEEEPAQSDTPATVATQTLVEQPPTADPVATTAAPVTPTLALTLALVVSVAVHRLSMRELFHRLSHLVPILHVLIWGLALITTAAWTARHLSAEWLLILTTIFLAATYIYSGWLRSVLAGVTLAFERRLHIGDEILAGDLQGVITRFGLRAIHLRADDGSLHDVPNDLLVNTPVTNLTGDGGDSACDITLDIPPHVSHDQALAILHSAAILSPLASPRHRPRAFLTPPVHTDAPFRVTVRGYAFDPHHREHFQSDVLARATQSLSHDHAHASWRDVIGYDGASPDD